MKNKFNRLFGDCQYMYLHLPMAKKMISIRLKPELIQHVKDQARKKKKEFTEYISDSLIETSNYKEKKITT